MSKAEIRAMKVQERVDLLENAVHRCTESIWVVRERETIFPEHLSLVYLHLCPEYTAAINSFNLHAPIRLWVGAGRGIISRASEKNVPPSCIPCSDLHPSPFSHAMLHALCLPSLCRFKAPLPT